MPRVTFSLFGGHYKKSGNFPTPKIVNSMAEWLKSALKSVHDDASLLPAYVERGKLQFRDGWTMKCVSVTAESIVYEVSSRKDGQCVIVIDRKFSAFFRP